MVVQFFRLSVKHLLVPINIKFDSKSCYYLYQYKFLEM